MVAIGGLQELGGAAVDTLATGEEVLTLETVVGPSIGVAAELAVSGDQISAGEEIGQGAAELGQGVRNVIISNGEPSGQQFTMDLQRFAEEDANNAPSSLKSDANEAESAGGHTLSRHVGKTDQELLDRLSGSKISASSSFTSQEVDNRKWTTGN